MENSSSKWPRLREAGHGKDRVLGSRCTIRVLLVEEVHIGPEVPWSDGSDVPAPEPLNQTPVLIVEAPIHCLVGPNTPIALVGCLFFFLDEAEVIGFEGELPLRRLLLLKEGYGEVLGQFLGSDR